MPSTSRSLVIRSASATKAVALATSSVALVIGFLQWVRSRVRTVRRRRRLPGPPERDRERPHAPASTAVGNFARRTDRSSPSRCSSAARERGRSRTSSRLPAATHGQPGPRRALEHLDHRRRRHLTEPRADGCPCAGRRSTRTSRAAAARANRTWSRLLSAPRVAATQAGNPTQSSPRHPLVSIAGTRPK